MANPRRRIPNVQIPLPDEHEGPTWECTLCYDELDRSVSPYFLDGELYCSDCVVRLFEERLQPDSTWPPIVGPAAYLDYRDFDAEIRTLGIGRFEACALRAKEADVVPIRSRVYCARRATNSNGNEPVSCEGFIGARLPLGSADAWIPCPSCLLPTCLICRGLDTDPDSVHTCPPNVRIDARNDLGEEKGYSVQECPRCEQVVGAIDGCNHYTCPCGEQFCFICGLQSHDDPEGEGRQTGRGTHWEYPGCPRYYHPNPRQDTGFPRWLNHTYSGEDVALWAYAGNTVIAAGPMPALYPPIQGLYRWDEPDEIFEVLNPRRLWTSSLASAAIQAHDRYRRGDLQKIWRLNVAPGVHRILQKDYQFLPLFAAIRYVTTFKHNTAVRAEGNTQFPPDGVHAGRRVLYAHYALQMRAKFRRLTRRFDININTKRRLHDQQVLRGLFQSCGQYRVATVPMREGVEPIRESADFRAILSELLEPYVTSFAATTAATGPAATGTDLIRMRTTNLTQVLRSLVSFTDSGYPQLLLHESCHVDTCLRWGRATLRAIQMAEGGVEVFRSQGVEQKLAVDLFQLIDTEVFSIFQGIQVDSMFPNRIQRWLQVMLLHITEEALKLVRTGGVAPDRMVELYQLLLEMDLALGTITPTVVPQRTKDILTALHTRYQNNAGLGCFQPVFRQALTYLEVIRAHLGVTPAGAGGGPDETPDGNGLPVLDPRIETRPLRQDESQPTDWEHESRWISQTLVQQSQLSITALNLKRPVHSRVAGRVRLLNHVFYMIQRMRDPGAMNSAGSANTLLALERIVQDMRIEDSGVDDMDAWSAVDSVIVHRLVDVYLPAFRGAA